VTDKKRILFVCLGNICRSPMAEGIMRNKIIQNNLPLEVDSAGTANYHVGECPDQRAIQTAKSYGVDISMLRGRQFSVNDFDNFDFIFAMDSSNYKNILRLARNDSDKSKVSYFLKEGNKGIDVPDPWFGEPEGFFPVYDLIDKACDKILNDVCKN
jgi:protein-tyrosine phosphatase